MLTRQTKLSQLVFVVIFLLLPAWRWGAALALVQLGDDGLDDVLHLLLLGLEVLGLGLLREDFSLKNENRKIFSEKARKIFERDNLPGYLRAT